MGCWPSAGRRVEWSFITRPSTRQPAWPPPAPDRWARLAIKPWHTTPRARSNLASLSRLLVLSHSPLPSLLWLNSDCTQLSFYLYIGTKDTVAYRCWRTEWNQTDPAALCTARRRAAVSRLLSSSCLHCVGAPKLSEMARFNSAWLRKTVFQSLMCHNALQYWEFKSNLRIEAGLKCSRVTVNAAHGFKC